MRTILAQIELEDTIGIRLVTYSAYLQRNPRIWLRVMGARWRVQGVVTYTSSSVRADLFLDEVPQLCRFNGKNCACANGITKQRYIRGNSFATEDLDNSSTRRPRDPTVPQCVLKL